MIDYQLYTFFPHTVTITSYTSKNSYGEDQVGTSRTALAYVEPGITYSRNTQTAEEQRPVTAYIADTNIGLHDLITFADGATPKIGTLTKYTFVEGLEHTVVTFL